MRTRATPGVWLAFLRITIGFAWLIAALVKILDPNYNSRLQATLEQWALSGHDAISAFITSSLLPNMYVLSFALKSAEVLVGISLIFGILTRLGAFGGFAIVAGAWVFKHGFASLSGYAGTDFIVLVTLLSLIFAPASSVLAADLLLARRRAGVTRPPAAPPPAAQPPPTVESTVV